ncbi:hypothetical protein [Vibrio sp. Hal054]|uniref:hypothetical protein n=1 Tax=Vibrio sp. Hal054 TaxID=3035158 RepID=UPI00301CB359
MDDQETMTQNSHVPTPHVSPLKYIVPTLLATTVVLSFGIAVGKYLPSSEQQRAATTLDTKSLSSKSVDAESINGTALQLTEKFIGLLGKTVRVVPLESTSLYAVMYDGKVLFTDEAGSVLISGDVLNTSSKLIVSDLMKADYYAQLEREALVKSSTLSALSHFGEHKEIQRAALAGGWQVHVSEQVAPSSLGADTSNASLESSLPEPEQSKGGKVQKVTLKLLLWVMPKAPLHLFTSVHQRR